jgi:hypothetical protein
VGALVVGVFTVESSVAVELRNQSYRLEISPEAISVSRLDAPAVAQTIRPELTLQFTPEDPDYSGRRNVVWKPDGKTGEPNFWKVGTHLVVKAVAVDRVDAGSARLEFPATPKGRLKLQVALPPGGAPPSFRWTLTAAQDGWFSIGFTGLESRDPARLDFLYQPLVWSWKRFPESPTLTPESFAPTALTFVNTAGFTEGVAPDVSEIPYRYATSANSRFGLALRDEAGRARPMLFAPILGGAESRLAAGESREFTVRYLLQPGDWYAGLTHFYRAVAGYRQERQNATCSLNETFENMIAFAMSDAYSGWVEELKGFDYRFDVPSTVKNVSASDILSVALTTGNMEIYRRRGLPVMEYLLSREKYLYADDETIPVQSPSHFLRGPAVELGELTALHALTGGRSSVFAREMARLFGKPRQLNLTTETGGASWQDHLARYRLARDPADLQAAREDADRYLAENVATYPTDFRTSAGLRDRMANFVTDYTPRLYDLMELHEETHEQRYLDAALVAARQMLLWLRSHPMAPDTTILANPGGRVPGVFPGRRHGTSQEFVPYDTSTPIPEQRVEAWRTSLVGLPPEAAGTYQFGPVMLAHHAPWLLRLAHLGQDRLLHEAACNGVLGRYANFPGYYFTSLDTTVYQQADYPLHSYYDIKYNAIFYNHVWPHIGLVQDFLVAEAYAKSRGEVDFPSAYAPGYAFLTSKVFGHRPGRVFGHEGVQLWLPPKALHTSTIALNHLFGTTADDTFLVLSNTRREETRAEIQLNPDVLRLHADVTYPLTFYQPDARPQPAELRDGRLSVRVERESVLAVRIHGLKNIRPLVMPAPPLPPPAGQDYFREQHDAPLGTVVGMLLRLGDLRTDAYLYSDITAKQARKLTLHYRLGDQPEQTIEDVRYPYEFSIPLPGAATPLHTRLVAEDLTGNPVAAVLPTLRGEPSPK